MTDDLDPVAGSNPHQRTKKWFHDRLGCLTASRCFEALTKTKSGKWTADREKLMTDLITERLTGKPVTKFSSTAMDWGTDHEAEAIDAYEFATDRLVKTVGFIHHPSIEFFGASPDGEVGTDGLIEIKCPNSGTHLSYIEAGGVPARYRPQMLCQLLCTGRKWVDFVSYDPRFKDEEMRLYICRFQPSAEELKDFEEQAVIFLQETADRLQRLLKAPKRLSEIAEE